MPHPLRIFPPGVSLHVRQRGNNRCPIFADDSDCRVFLAILRQASRRYGAVVHGYALMRTHTHLLVTPRDELSLPKTMQQLGVRYVLYFNRKYARVGTLWTGRYLAKLVPDDCYWLTCLRYIEQNPVRAGIVEQPGDYLWSSYGVHGLGLDSDWLAGHPVFDALGANSEQRRAAYRVICATPMTPDQILAQQFGG
jgi:putative transposase